jgi:hypothetical protein
MRPPAATPENRARLEDLAVDLGLNDPEVETIWVTLGLLDELEVAHAPFGLDEVTIQRYIRTLRERRPDPAAS